MRERTKWEQLLDQLEKIEKNTRHRQKLEFLHQLNRAGVM